METTTTNGSDQITESPTRIVASEFRDIGDAQLAVHRHQDGVISISLVKSGGGGGAIYVSLGMHLRPGQGREVAMALLAIDTTLPA